MDDLRARTDHVVREQSGTCEKPFEVPGRDECAPKGIRTCESPSPTLSGPPYPELKTSGRPKGTSGLVLGSVQLALARQAEKEREESKTNQPKEDISWMSTL